MYLSAPAFDAAALLRRPFFFKISVHFQSVVLGPSAVDCSLIPLFFCFAVFRGSQLATFFSVPLVSSADILSTRSPSPPLRTHAHPFFCLCGCFSAFFGCLPFHAFAHFSLFDDSPSFCEFYRELFPPPLPLITCAEYSSLIFSVSPTRLDFFSWPSLILIGFCLAYLLLSVGAFPLSPLPSLLCFAHAFPSWSFDFLLLVFSFSFFFRVPCFFPPNFFRRS